MEVIAFTKVALPYGWLGNMSPHPIEYAGKKYRTAESLFQCLRFGSENDAIKEEIRAAKSPIAAKMVAKKYAAQMTVEPMSVIDCRLMEVVIKEKLAQHPDLLTQLLATGDATIIEDVTSRGAGGRHRFWGAAKVGDEWVGENTLGKLWMEIRGEKRLVENPTVN